MGASQHLLVAPQQLMGAPQQLHAGSTAAAYGSNTAVVGSTAAALPQRAMLDHHRMPAVAHHGDVRLISGGPLATFFSDGVSLVVYQWQIPPSDSRLHVAGGPPVAF